MEKSFIKYKNFREMNDRVGYCRFCGEKTVHECDVEGQGYFLKLDSKLNATSEFKHFKEDRVPTCEDCWTDFDRKGKTE